MCSGQCFNFIINKEEFKPFEYWKLNYIKYNIKNDDSMEKYLQKVLSFEIANKHLEILSKCNCCERHQNNRPSNIEDNLDNLPKYDCINFHKCDCDCRHNCRIICRAFNNKIEII